MIVYFGKLPSNLQDRILEWKDVEDLPFEELIRFLKKRKRDTEFKGLVDMRSRRFANSVSMGTMPQGQQFIQSVNSEFYQRRTGGVDVPCYVCNCWGYSTAQCIQLKSCNKCRHKGHLARYCPNKGAIVRSSGVQGVNLIRDTVGEPFVHLYRGSQ